VITEQEVQKIWDWLLEAGVPPTAIATAFQADPIVLRERQADLRVRHYGSAELSEALANLQWEALERAREFMSEGTSRTRQAFIMSILGKSLSLTGRQNPEQNERLRQDLETLMIQVAAGNADDDLGALDTSAYIPLTVPTDEGAAEPPAPADEDQDQGSPY
jgi:hypothetical protein